MATRKAVFSLHGLMPELSSGPRGNDEDRAMRVLDDLTGADPIGSRVNPPAPREPRTIVSAAAPVMSRPGRSPGTLVLTPGRTNCLELT